MARYTVSIGSFGKQVDADNPRAAILAAFAEPSAWLLLDDDDPSGEITITVTCESQEK